MEGHRGTISHFYSQNKSRHDGRKRFEPWRGLVFDQTSPADPGRTFLRHHGHKRWGVLLGVIEIYLFQQLFFLVPFDQLFPKSEPIEINHLPEDDQDGSSLASSSTEREPPKDFVTDMVQKIEMEYQRLLKVEKQRVERFRLNNRDNQCPQGKNVNSSSRELLRILPIAVELIERYQQTECHLTLHCKMVLEKIQEMQGNFKDPQSLKNVTVKLEELWQHIEQDDQLKTKFNVGLKEISNWSLYLYFKRRIRLKPDRTSHGSGQWDGRYWLRQRPCPPAGRSSDATAARPHPILRSPVDPFRSSRTREVCWVVSWSLISAMHRYYWTTCVFLSQATDTAYHRSAVSTLCRDALLRNR